MQQQVLLTDLGHDQPYKEIWDLQERLLQQKVQLKSEGKNDEADLLLLVEHKPVYTLGKSGDINNVLISEDDCNEKGIDFFKINRGGDITFHGPGQLVGYPIINLEKYKTDLGWYLRSLEEVIILTMAAYGLKGARS